MALGSIAILKMLKLSIHEHGISFHLFRSSLISFSKESANAGDTGYIYLWVRKSPWRRKWQPTLAFLSGKSHGQRSLAGYSP